MMSTLSQAATENATLNALSDTELRLISPETVLIAARRGQVLHEVGKAYPFVFFPSAGLISIVIANGRGRELEVGMVGNEGLVGVPALLGADKCLMSAVARTDSIGIGIAPETLRSFMKASDQAAERMRRYAQAFLMMLAQGCLCNGEHLIEQRLARWILMADDRVPLHSLRVTQEAFSRALGVRRASIAEAAEKLQGIQAVRYRRGEVAILDRHRLEEVSCDCYQAIKREMDRLHPECHQAG